MQIYESLLEDEKAMHVPFAMSFIVTITTIVGQLKQSSSGAFLCVIPFCARPQNGLK